jgi:hypothetical protein
MTKGETKNTRNLLWRDGTKNTAAETPRPAWKQSISPTSREFRDTYFSLNVSAWKGTRSTNPAGQSPASVPSSSLGQEIPRPKVHHNFHKSSQLGYILCQLNPVHSLKPTDSFYYYTLRCVLVSEVISSRLKFLTKVSHVFFFSCPVISFSLM